MRQSPKLDVVEQVRALRDEANRLAKELRAAREEIASMHVDLEEALRLARKMLDIMNRSRFFDYASKVDLKQNDS